MNFDIIVDNSIGPFVVKTSGKMTGEDFVAMGKGLLDHSLWVAGESVIFDHTELDFSEASLAALELIRGFHKENEKQIGSGMSAIVVRPGFSLEWHKLWNRGKKIQAGNKVKVFENFKDALRWIEEQTACS